MTFTRQSTCTCARRLPTVYAGRLFETVVKIPGSPRRTFIVLFWSKHSSKESNAMFGPGAYRPDPTEGITALAELPQPESVPSSRNAKQHAGPRCGSQASRDQQFQRPLHDLGHLAVC